MYSPAAGSGLHTSLPSRKYMADVRPADANILSAPLSTSVPSWPSKYVPPTSEGQPAIPRVGDTCSVSANWRAKGIVKLDGV